MKIQKIVNQIGRDFYALMECEHCCRVQEMNHGYDDAFFHDKVIPAMKCKACGLDRAGNVVEAVGENPHVSG